MVLEVKAYRIVYDAFVCVCVGGGGNVQGMPGFTEGFNRLLLSIN